MLNTQELLRVCHHETRPDCRYEFNEQDKPNVFWQVEILPGGSADTTFTAPDEPGEYEIVCHIPGHVQAGMVGKLNVVSGK